VTSIAVAGSAARAALRVARVLALAVSIALALVGFAIATSDTEPATDSLVPAATAVPRLVRVGSDEAVVVEVAGRTHVFLPSDARGDALAYCPAPGGRGLLVGQYWGSVFALDGQKLVGPAPRDLDELAFRARGSSLDIDAAHVIKGRGYQATPAVRTRPRTLEPGWCPTPAELRRWAGRTAVSDAATLGAAEGSTGVGYWGR
jgi:hypothetical protein